MIDTSKYTNEELQEMFWEEQRQNDALCFIVSSRRDEIENKERAVLHLSFEDLLNENIDLYKYVKIEKARQIIIIYQIFDLIRDEKYNIKREHDISFDKRKELRTYPLMTKEEYRKYENCSTADALKILCKKTLEGITALKKYEKRLNFNWQGLITEMSELFEKKFSYDSM